MQYRLYSVETAPVTLRMFPKTLKNGTISYGHYVRLEPNKTYETEDEAQKKYLRENRTRVRYNANLEATLKNAGVPYEVVKCKSCGGRVKKIEYNQVEVIE